MTDWGRYVGCEKCPALAGERCFTLSSGGPQALPPRYAEVPHSGRKLRGSQTRKVAVAKSGTANTNVQRRRAAKQQSTVARWQALAERSRGGS